VTPDPEVERLRTRLVREQRARRQAEEIAERGIRDLWEANRQLQDRVAQRTAQLQRSSAALSLITQRWATELASAAGTVLADARTSTPSSGRLGRLARVAIASPGPTSLPPVASSLGSMADELLGRWQRYVARSGQLLTVSAVHPSVEVVAHWELVVAAVDMSLVALSSHGPGGAVPVELDVVDGVVSVRIHHARLAVPSDAAASSRDHASFDRLGPVGTPLMVAARIVADGGGRLTAVIGPEGLAVVISIPIIDGGA
jgi:hypothetical protein